MSDKLHVYTGEDVTVTWDGALCIHHGACTRGLRDVFDVKKKPWIQPDQASVDAVMDVVRQCPTGALMAKAKDGRTEAAPARNTVTMRVNGPLFVHGRLKVGDAPAPHAGTRLALCRCGASGNMPFCDSSHKESGFRHDGTAAAGELEALGHGELVLQPLENGPVQVDGPCEVRDRDGEAIWSGTQTWLCRCGRSASKPFCDGTHRRIGFEAEGTG